MELDLKKIFQDKDLFYFEIEKLVINGYFENNISDGIFVWNPI